MQHHSLRNIYHCRTEVNMEAEHYPTETVTDRPVKLNSYQFESLTRQLQEDNLINPMNPSKLQIT